MGRIRVRNVDGILPIKEAEKKDEVWTQRLRDTLYNHLLAYGFSPTQFAIISTRLGRSIKSCRRQWEIILYIDDKASIIESYQVTALRYWRGGTPLSAGDREVLRVHSRPSKKTHRKVPLVYTALILQRPVEEVQNQAALFEDESEEQL